MKQFIKQPVPIRQTNKYLPDQKKGRSAITESKKSKLDALNLQVINAQIEVNQYQAMVTSLIAKTANFSTYMSQAETRRTQTLNNKTLIDQLVQSAKDLDKNSNIVFTDMVKANEKTKQLADKIKQLIDKLIFTSEMIGRLSIMVVRQKALNPLISDDLVSKINQAGSDANNAVSLTLVALNTTIACEATNMESEAATALGFEQANILYATLTGNGDGNSDKPTRKESLQGLLHLAYKKAKEDYEIAQTAWNMSNDQLNFANSKLSDAQVKLQSLQAGLAAGNAAALAS
jgi:hypothetical protein